MFDMYIYDIYALILFDVMWCDVLQYIWFNFILVICFWLCNMLFHFFRFVLSYFSYGTDTSQSISSSNNRDSDNNYYDSNSNHTDNYDDNNGENNDNSNDYDDGNDNDDESH